MSNFSFYLSYVSLLLFAMQFSCAEKPIKATEKQIKSKDFSSEKIMSDQEQIGKISLSGNASIENEKLVIEYTIQNNQNHIIYTFDEMIEYDDKAQPKINSETAYVFWEEPSTLRVVRGILNIPLEKDVYSLEIPYSREVKPDESIQGKIVLDIPVKEKSPFYALPTEENSKIIDCKNIRLIIGWTKFREGTQITTADIGGKEVLRIRGSWKPRLIEKKFELKTKVQTHTEVFDRQMPQQYKEN